MPYALALTLIRGLTIPHALVLLRNLPDAKRFFDRPEPTLSYFLPNLNPTMRSRLVAAAFEQRKTVLARAEQECDFCARHSIRILPVNHPDYPRRLAECPDAPPVLFYRGAADLNARHMISVVGTRRITPYGKDLCRLLCHELAQRCPDVVVVSGLAYGVDVATHRGCLEHHLSTVGILAHGLDQIYPATHRDTAKEMLAQGGLLTEHLTRTRPVAGNFVRRNRIVAGMSEATLVVESAAKGGALITARLAMDYDRLVCAFPGRSIDPYSAGCNTLIRRHEAELVTSPAEVIDLLGWDAKPRPKEVQLDLFPEDLTPEQQLLLETLRKEEALSPSQLILRTGLDLSLINELLFELELSGRVALLPGGNYRYVPMP